MKNPFIIILIVFLILGAVSQLASITVQILSFNNVAVSLLVIFGIIFTIKISKS